jgi:hypothetical protein
MWKKHGGLNQQWDVVYADEYPAEPTKGQFNKDFGMYVERPFNVISEIGTHRYLTVINNRDFVIKVSNGRKEQQWYFDQKTLTIKSSYSTGRSWDIRSSNKVNLYNTNSQWYQIFVYEGQFFTNIQDNRVLDVQGNKDNEHQPVIVHKRHGGVN